jgi:hypothetical protein
MPPQPYSLESESGKGANANHEVYRAMLQSKLGDGDSVASQARYSPSVSSSSTLRAPSMSSTQTPMQHEYQQHHQHHQQGAYAPSAAALSVYQSINANQYPELQTQHAYHPLTMDECDVFTSMLSQCTRVPRSVCVAPNHYINNLGEICGFRMNCHEAETASVLPINRQMFFRNTMLECMQDTPPDECEHIILQLLLDKENVKQRLLDLVAKIYGDSIGKEASFECLQDSSDEAGLLLMGSSNTDCAEWNPEMPSFVGLFHAYVKTFNNDSRHHKLFIVTSGGCTSICNEYFNMFVDVRRHMTVGELLQSEETWYLRRVNERNNARIIAMVADEFKIPIQKIVDSDAMNHQTMARITTETVKHDMFKMHGSQHHVSVTNQCTDTSKGTSGIICCMHPSEV